MLLSAIAPNLIFSLADYANGELVIAQYEQMIDRIDDHCWEDRKAVALIAYGTTNLFKKSGEEVSYHDTLQTFVYEAEARYEDEMGYCFEIYSDLTSHLRDS